MVENSATRSKETDSSSDAKIASAIKPHVQQAITIQDRNIEQLRQNIPKLYQRLTHLFLSRAHCSGHPTCQQQRSNAIGEQSSLNLQGQAPRACDCVNQKVAKWINEIYPATTFSYKQSRNSQANQKKGASCRGEKSGEETCSSSTTSHHKFQEIFGDLQKEKSTLEEQLANIEEATKFVQMLLVDDIDIH
uniref:Uncharacterized protein n=1 Tax=Romanomermis culicivorax TaxID=13658 RepID=A0A915KB23_ROMCU